MKYFVFLGMALILTLSCNFVSSFQKPGRPVPNPPLENAADPENSALVNVYDPARIPGDDLKAAIVAAQKENKRILLELGGDWCIWCKHMDDFYATHADILRYRAEHYVLVKVNVSDENMNGPFVSQFPEPAGYPHIYILDSDGTFVHSQNTADLEDGANSYVPKVFMAFLQKWAATK